MVTADARYSEQLLETWEGTYKKGQLTLWLLLSIRDQPRYISEIKEFINTHTQGTLTCEDQSVYRALRKFYDLEIVDYELRDGHKGPERKYYGLTSIGKNLLQEFIDRNMRILYNKSLVDILFNGGKPV